MSKSEMIAYGLLVIGVIGFAFMAKWLLGIVSIGPNQIGVVEKKFRLFGKDRELPPGRVVALKGEAGIQAETMAPGLYFWYWPWQYSVSKMPFTEIEAGSIGIVEAIDGEPIPSGRVLARDIPSDSFQDARLFLSEGGQRGPQIGILPPGSYRINQALFNVKEVPSLKIKENVVGIVTTNEGAPLTTGEIAGRVVPDHNSFQKGQAFVDHGGFKGLQEQVLLTGAYYMNPNFVSVSTVDMTSVPIGSVGVVISYVGEVMGVDETSTFKQGAIVKKGFKGVWAEPLDPGKYPMNPFTCKVELVPTTNIVLNWAEAKTEAHNLDKNLSTITVRSADGFTFNLDVSQIIHISRQNAAKVIARFGNMTNLVTQVLEPLIGNYFRNSAQTSDVIEFLRNRSARQEDARKHIEEALAQYDVQAVDTLIGDITPPEALMVTLTDRKVAEQKTITYNTQKIAEDSRQLLQEATAMADTRASIVAASRAVEVAEYNAQAVAKQAEGVANAKTTNATADAMVLRTVGAAEGAKVTAVGEAEAAVLQKKVSAVGAGPYALMNITQDLSAAGMKIVPEIMVTGGAEGGPNAGMGNIMSALIGTMLARMNEDKAA